MAGAPSALGLPLHADLVLLAERRRGLFRRADQTSPERGVFPSLVALLEAINRFIDHHNQAPMPFTWKADPKDIIAAAKRGHQTLQTIH
jgi:hypothetical protein